MECVGCADRSAFDLTQHTSATGERLSAEKPLPAPRTIDVLEVVPDKAQLGKTLKKDAKAVTDALQKLTIQEIEKLETELNAKGEYVLQAGGIETTLTPSVVTVKRGQKTVHVEEITPSVIEPSFGIGRIMYAVLEHSFRVREGDEQRTYLTLPPLVAPYKCSLLPLSTNPEFQPFIRQLCECFKFTFHKS